jgi:hypothetical protein
VKAARATKVAETAKITERRERKVFPMDNDGVDFIAGMFTFANMRTPFLAQKFPAKHKKYPKYLHLFIFPFASLREIFEHNGAFETVRRDETSVKTNASEGMQVKKRLALFLDRWVFFCRGGRRMCEGFRCERRTQNLL